MISLFGTLMAHVWLVQKSFIFVCLRDRVESARNHINDVVIFVKVNIVNAHDTPFLRQHHMYVLIFRVNDVEDLMNHISWYEWIVFVTNTFKVHGNLSTVS